MLQIYRRISRIAWRLKMNYFINMVSEKPERNSKESAFKIVLRFASTDSKHVQYCQSDTDRESTSRPDKLLRTVSIPYGSCLFVSTLGGRVKRLHNQQDMPTAR